MTSACSTRPRQQACPPTRLPDSNRSHVPRHREPVTTVTGSGSRDQTSSGGFPGLGLYLPDPMRPRQTKPFSLPCKPVPSDGVAPSLITAVQRDVAVWVRRAGSGIARSRCHLACHWLRDLQTARGATASGRYLPAIQPLMAWSIALSTLLCYYPPELPASAPVRVGELFGIADGTIRAALSGLVAAVETMGRRPGDGCGHPPPASRPSASPCARA